LVSTIAGSGVTLVVADYLRKQANRCLSWARDCFDLETATRLRLLAEELRAKADEIDVGAPRMASSHMQQQPMQQQQTKQDDGA
jgi:hypothetical protein